MGLERLLPAIGTWTNQSVRISLIAGRGRRQVDSEQFFRMLFSVPLRDPSRSGGEFFSSHSAVIEARSLLDRLQGKLVLREQSGKDRWEIELTLPSSVPRGFGQVALSVLVLSRHDQEIIGMVEKFRDTRFSNRNMPIYTADRAGEFIHERPQGYGVLFAEKDQMVSDPVLTNDILHQRIMTVCLSDSPQNPGSGFLEQMGAGTMMLPLPPGRLAVGQIMELVVLQAFHRFRSEEEKAASDPASLPAAS